MNGSAAAQPLYSPLEPLKYSRHCRDIDCFVGVGPQLASEEDRAAWNLYWLSDPLVDLYLEGSHDADLEMLGACLKAVDQKVNDRIVGELVTTLPAPQFAQLLTPDNVKKLAPYRLRGRAWLDTVLARCGQYRGMVRDEGNVRYANFGRRANVTKPTGPGIIMTLALPQS